MKRKVLLVALVGFGMWLWKKRQEEIAAQRADEEAEQLWLQKEVEPLWLKYQANPPDPSTYLTFDPDIPDDMARLRDEIDSWFKEADDDPPR